MHNAYSQRYFPSVCEFSEVVTTLNVDADRIVTALNVNTYGVVTILHNEYRQKLPQCLYIQQSSYHTQRIYRRSNYHTAHDYMERNYQRAFEFNREVTILHMYRRSIVTTLHVDTAE